MDGNFIKNVLEYIRGFFPGSSTDRKRRGSSSFYSTNNNKAKIRKISPSSPETTRIIPILRETEDSLWLPRKRETEFSLKKSFRTPMATLRAEEIIDLVDKEDDLSNSLRGRSRIFNNTGTLNKTNKFTSTPLFEKSSKMKSFENDNNDEADDVIYVKTLKYPKENLTFKTPHRNGKSFNNNTSKNNNHSSMMSFTKEKSKFLQDPVLDCTFRLFDKSAYKKLLEQQGSSRINHNSSNYHTPIAELFESFSNLPNRNNSSTNNNNNKQQKKKKPIIRESTKDHLIKMLDNLENEPISIKDTDSEESVIFVNPPSPKPDIKVDPVNSFRRIVDTCEVSSRDWLDQVVKDHKKNVDERQREINNIRECCRQSEEINRDINCELLRRRIQDCLQIKDVILPEIYVIPDTEFPELTEEHHQQFLQKAWGRGDPNQVLAQKFNLNITRRDLYTLNGLNWLNDEVINFYMNLITERSTKNINSKQFPKTWTFNTFFYMKLIKDGPQSLRRWTKKVDLFSYDLICIPIHLGMHWCMCIVDFRDKSIRYFDSMGSSNNKCLEAMERYLRVEHLDKKNSEFDTSSFQLINMADIPQQMNGSDCGMFACTFAEFASRNSSMNFAQKDMPYLRKKMVVEIMLGELLIK